ncbi:LacI family DNA-binding transcriptional regulator [Arthrobacter tumbae]|uniref:LacI family DNA-binding transcriptional regulator n=1 Tax=Arthrobacter tumbae TaxID=163874 RepID=UPI0027DDEEE2|nr:LacI family DNA-binding transcriptional regulator [Arthrobacter tumbae]MBM7781664.1 DNA-binding LacI/PurR family transcriptional regulator [Arthrobacter tumbae]
MTVNSEPTPSSAGQPPARSRSANIRDVAKAAGVSHQTVSRVINGHPSLRESTRQRVLDAMEALQFRPNRAARSLVTSRSGMIGVLVTDGTYFGPASTRAAIESAASSAGYLVDTATLTSLEETAFKEALGRLVDHAVEGLIVLAPQEATLRQLAHLPVKLPMVTVHSTSAADDHGLSVDQVAGARLATRHLLELGHRSIAHVAGPDGWVESKERIRGFRTEMAGWGLDSSWIVAGDWTSDSGFRIGRELLAADPPTAVFSSNDQMALGVTHACSDRGLRVPEDISIVGFDDVPDARHFAPPLTTVRQDFAELGRRCVAHLLTQLGVPAQNAPRTVVPELIVRRSTAAPS